MSLPASFTRNRYRGQSLTNPAPVAPPSRLLTSANPHFSDNGRRGRYGVAYLRALSAHAGVGFHETPSDEDVDALDVILRFGRASAEVQVKCTGGFKVGQGSATLALESAWVEKWAGSYHPVFVVLVKVPPAVPAWIESKQTVTNHRTVAFGKRFDRLHHVKTMKFTKSDQLTAETLYDWRDEVYAFHEAQQGGTK
ncbi:DUF4365 domain-containing protein [Cryobacterium sp. W22_MBD10_FK3]|uniref:DUF4365 domain-containing protein n=1 Tax=Cryobacterium sp. W22_MBD10_FK3 TaxID=3240273 RepID=UPI003F8E77A3